MIANGLAISYILKLKNKMNMKNLIKYGFIAFVICFFSGCTTEVIVTKEEKKLMEEKEKIEEQKAIESELRIITLDGCEYYKGGYFNRGYMSHKGNCKNPIHNCR